MKKYYRHYVRKNISVRNIVTIEYLNVKKGFTSDVESHPFFEFAYVDKGSVKCVMDGEENYIKQGELFFILPNTEHYYKKEEKDDTILFIVCACSKAEILDIIGGKHALDERCRGIISSIFSEAKKAFKFPFNKKLVPLDSQIYGSQQLTETYIEILLTRLVRQCLTTTKDVKFVLNSEDFNEKIVSDIMEILKNNIYQNINLDFVAKEVHYSKTYINDIFKTNLGVSIMHYYSSLKFNEAKKMLDSECSIKNISDKLSFSNPNYFTKAFKNFLGLTPTQYKRSINK